jgi:hypothetical protein
MLDFSMAFSLSLSLSLSPLKIKDILKLRTPPGPR